jgi:hypothetical protein
VNIVMTTVVADGIETLDANVAFHLNAGVDFVLVAALGSQDDTAAILERYAREGHLRTIPARGGGESLLTDMARAAVAEHAADWVVPSTPAEFCWPRGESLKDVLAVIPQRYSVVQALVRSFTGRRGESFFADEMTLRTSLLSNATPRDESPHRMLRPIYRTEQNLVIDPEDWTLGGRRVPLRAWYPIEVFHFPAPPSDIEEARLDERVASGELVADTRLKDALRGLRDENSGRFAPPTAGEPGIAFPVPTIVDDASYAVECAAVGEVDLVRLDRHIRELELRIAALEAPFWPSVRRAVRRLARRPS